jgi:hypothetical protein
LDIFNQRPLLDLRDWRPQKSRRRCPRGLTPHSLRRTFISLLLAMGEEVPYVMRQVGHADPKVTLSIYAQVMFRGEGERERLKALVEGSDWAPLGTTVDPKVTKPGEQLSLEALTTVDAGDSESGRSWTRTRDLFLIRQGLEGAPKPPESPFPSGMVRLPPPPWPAF